MKDTKDYKNKLVSAAEETETKRKGIFFKIAARLKENSFFSFFIDWVKRLGRDRVNLVSAQLAYYLILAFFPFTIFLLSIFSYSRFGHEEILAKQLALLPAAAADLLKPVIMDIINSRSTALLSSSLFLALWSSSTGMHNLLNAMCRTFNEGEGKRSFVKGRLLAIATTFLIVVLIALMLISQVFGNIIYSYLAKYLAWGSLGKSIWNYALTLLPLFILSLGLAFLYRYGPYFPPGKRLPFRIAWISAIAASIGWLLISYGFRIYVSNFANYSNAYGSLGGIIILVLWLYFSAFVIMAGSVLASVWQDRSKMKKTKRAEISENMA